MKRNNKIFTTTRMIALGFFAAIVLGTILLSLPIATKSRTVTPFVDSVFTATTSTCVTGLTTVVTVEHWSLFGQLVILFLIQFGGLGIVTFSTVILLILGKRISLKERLLIQEAYNLDTLQGLVAITIRVMKGTLVVEGIGAVLYSVRFINDYGPVRGIWYAIFHSVSAFCNAGIDLLGSSSLEKYQTDVLINVVTMLLIILGGIGFPIWWEVVNNIRNVRKKWKRDEKAVLRFSYQFKVVVTITLILIAAGTVLTLIMEYDNPETLKPLKGGQKLLAALFQSVTLRTAGFATISQKGFREATCLVYLLLMIIGGSPSGTAGGIKTTTAAVIGASVLSTVRGKEDVSLMKRKIPDRVAKKALAVTGVSIMAIFVLALLLTAVQKSNFLDTIYEVISATATVGLSRDLTQGLNAAGKWIIILGMYLGRIGPITMALAFNSKRSGARTSNPTGRLMVG